ncbi:DinB family protein [Modestobacter sp. VKM Ac-2977]|uniref:DinB family protein n=1 Tax=Modestobacter sp. VKM Ac-2977 TaxID=3004131 RepID=UPI0022AA21B1|nr:DinB family protein [Modestobacter sp. VKM Ac-2977]MCZ2822659.1 DinB family protein [Modestobacter sp. VKM Ac-2977]
MTALPPAPTRVDPPFTDGERAAVEAWLDFHRATLLTTCAGLTPEQLGERSVPPSSLSLRGLLRHMTDVERYWFTRVVAGREAPTVYWADEDDVEFDGVGADGDDPTTAVPAELAAFTAEVEASRAVAAGHTSLDDVGAGLRHGERVSLRWVYLHMIEEYARHNGHADLLRERTDGTTS